MRLLRGWSKKVATMRGMQERIGKLLVPNGLPSAGSATVLELARIMVAQTTVERMVEVAEQVHDLCDELNPEEKYPTDHLIDMISSCASAIRFAFDSPCQSRHAAAAAYHVWKHRYGVTLFDRFTGEWQKDWTHAVLGDAILDFACSASTRAASSAPATI